MSRSPGRFAGRLLTISVVAGFAALAGPSLPVSAACGTPVAPADALTMTDLVFAGTVTTVADGGTTATFDVESIWKGPNLANPIEVYGGGPGVSDPRTWQTGQRYLVFPHVETDGTLTDTACSPTSLYQASFDALRPADARPPQGAPTSGIPGEAPYAAIFLVIIVFGSVGAFFFWRTGQLGPPDGQPPQDRPPHDQPPGRGGDAAPDPARERDA